MKGIRIADITPSAWFGRSSCAGITTRTSLV